MLAQDVPDVVEAYESNDNTETVIDVAIPLTIVPAVILAT